MEKYQIKENDAPVICFGSHKTVLQKFGDYQWKLLCHNFPQRFDCGHKMRVEEETLNEASWLRCRQEEWREGGWNNPKLSLPHIKKMSGGPSFFIWIRYYQLSLSLWLHCCAHNKAFTAVWSLIAQRGLACSARRDGMRLGSAIRTADLETLRWWLSGHWQNMTLSNVQYIRKQRTVVEYLRKTEEDWD